MPHEIAKQIIRKGTILSRAMSEDKHHLYFICHDPVYIEEYRKDVFLSVNITTIKGESILILLVFVVWVIIHSSKMIVTLSTTKQRYLVLTL